MNKKRDDNLRIVCLCGQKMQVTPAMYGCAANCIACKQKLFVPEANEIEEGTKIIYLKDRLELLRKPREYERQDLKKDTPPPADDSPMEEELSFLPRSQKEGSSGELESELSKEEVFFRDTNVAPETIDPRVILDSAVPLDPYAPLQRWAGFKNALAAARHNNDSWDQAEVYDQIEKDLDEVHADIHKGIVEELHDAQERLTEVQEEIADFVKSLRDGEISLSYFYHQVDSLRTHREILARRIYSLEQWINYTPDSLLYPADKLSLDEFDKEGFLRTHNFTDWQAPSLPLGDYYCSRLEKSFEKKDSLKKVVDSEKQIVPNEKPLATEATIKLSLVHCRIHFIRTRLEQLIEDCDSDFDALVHNQIELLSAPDQSKAVWNKIRGGVLELQQASQQQLALKDKLSAYYEANSLDTLVFVETETAEIETPLTFPFIQILALSLASFALLGYFFLLLPSEKDIPFSLAVLPSLLLLGHIFLVWQFAAARRIASLLFFWTVELAVLLGCYFFLQKEGYLAIKGSVDYNALAHLLFLTGLCLVIGGNASELINTMSVRARDSVSLRVLSFLLVTLLAALIFLQLPSLLSFTEEEAFFSEDDHALIDDEEYSFTGLVAPQPRGYSEVAVEDDFTEEEEVDTEDDVYLEEDDEFDEADAALNEPELYLSGVVHAPGRDPRFRATLRMPDGTEENMTLLLGEVVLGDWVASEYNHSGKRLILSDGQQMLVLQAGKTVSLPVEDEELE